jgi:hypothetical protein
MALLAPVKWELGDLAEARAQIEQTMVRANDSAYSLDRLFGCFWKTILESLVGNAEAALHAGEVVVEIARRHETKHYLSTFNELINVADGSRRPSSSIGRQKHHGGEHARF